jgi:LmbE family N-acetylglucosaminyl deacetylase
MTRVLVLGAHPDDEATGCGGAVRRHTVAGDLVHAVFLTSGEAGGHGIEDPGAVREREALEAAGILGIAEVEFWRFPDGRLRASAAAIERLVAKLRAFRPRLVYAPHPREDHPDHRATYRLLRRALAVARSRPRVLGFEIWTPIEPIEEIVDISEHIEAKLAAIRAYRSQCEVMSFDDAFEALARYRGEMHLWPGGPYAEVFREL